jgi:ABC-type lipoprotein release transport system permease subunit
VILGAAAVILTACAALAGAIPAARAGKLDPVQALRMDN